MPSNAVGALAGLPVFSSYPKTRTFAAGFREIGWPQLASVDLTVIVRTVFGRS
jgi:hypothetical protein